MAPGGVQDRGLLWVPGGKASWTLKAFYIDEKDSRPLYALNFKK